MNWAREFAVVVSAQLISEHTAVAESYGVFSFTRGRCG